LCGENSSGRGMSHEFTNNLATFLAGGFFAVGAVATGFYAMEFGAGYSAASQFEFIAFGSWIAAAVHESYGDAQLGEETAI